jgi:hypothetical protein
MLFLVLMSTAYVGLLCQLQVRTTVHCFLSLCIDVCSWLSYSLSFSAFVDLVVQEEERNAARLLLHNVEIRLGPYGDDWRRRGSDNPP